MISQLRPAAVLLLLLTLITGVAYPLAVTGVAQIAMPFVANGSLVDRSGAVVGSRLIGQAFASDVYFHGRPSAAGQNGYDAAASSGSNLGPLSKKLMDRVAADADRLKAEGASTLPADAVTASASGLDPHISPAFARLQVDRVAKARGVEPGRVGKLVDEAIETPFLGVIGEPRVNVLDLNLAVDAAFGPKSG